MERLMMNSILACSSGGWLMIAGSVVFYFALGLAIFWLIRKLRSGNSPTPPTDGGTSFRAANSDFPEAVTLKSMHN
jgi:hypothetical protein